MINRNDVDVLEDDILQLDRKLLKTLLVDRTTQKNILWATDDYDYLGSLYSKSSQITIEAITGANSKLIQPRVEKEKAHQERRTKKSAEVFTPSWVCNEQNNLIDREWFGRDGVFNVAYGKMWVANLERIQFPDKKAKHWQKYVDAKRLEITCGEAPYLVSRYDTVTGQKLTLSSRIGLLDRKLRVVTENASSDEEWLKWAERAVQSVYGFEYQGDNLLLARENVLLTYMDYFEYKFNREPKAEELQNIALIISWNLWQMDGLNYAIPNCGELPFYQMSIFDLSENEDDYAYLSLLDPKDKPLCKIRDWRSKETIVFKSLVKGGLL